jgi:hypothetical protein
LKQLKVAISTGASLPDGSSPQNSKTNFVDLRDDGSNFQKLANIPPKAYSIEIRELQVSSTCLQVFMQNGKVGEGDVFSRKNVFIALFA